MNRLIKTSDGSHTIYVPELDDHYHSIHGAVQESSHIFIKNGFDTSTANPVNIFEVGFGTGLNALLTAIRSMNGDREVSYTTIEKYPVHEDLIWSLNHSEFAGKEGKKIFNLIHYAPWNSPTRICKNFTIKKIKSDLTVNKPTGIFDLIYFDAFGPEKQPEMWTPAIFKSIAEITNKSGILVTYSAKGDVKRNLKECGFEVSLLPGPPGKRQITRAVKI